MADKENNVVSLSETIAKKQSKEKELDFYRRHLDMIQQRMAFLEMDRKVTLEIIEMVENETIVTVDASLPVIDIDDDDYNLD